MVRTVARMVRSLTSRVEGALFLLAPALLAAAVPVGPSVSVAPALPPLVSTTPTICWGLAGPIAAAKDRALSAPAAPPEYYGFPIVSTRRVPGTGRATGGGLVTFVSSPFGFAVAPSSNWWMGTPWWPDFSETD